MKEYISRSTKAKIKKCYANELSTAKFTEYDYLLLARCYDGKCLYNNVLAFGGKGAFSLINKITPEMEDLTMIELISRSKIKFIFKH